MTEAAPRDKVTISTLLEMMEQQRQISMLTCYDYPTALILERTGIDILLVGDSLGMTVLGYDTTLPVTMEVMIPHAQAVRRGALAPFLIGDMPYMSYQASIPDAIRNAGRFMAEAGCDAVKLEGGRNVADVVEALTRATIPVMGHLGLTPQSLSQLGGFRAQGRTAEAGRTVIEDAAILEEAGACSILVEAVPPEVCREITRRASIPIIGIGSGPHCHGQLLIVHDMLGFFDRFTPRFVKRYADLTSEIDRAAREFISDIRSGAFPAPEHCYGMKQGEADRLTSLLSDDKQS